MEKRILALSPLTDWHSRSTHKQHFEQPQSSLWMNPPLHPNRNSPPQLLPRVHCSPNAERFRQTDFAMSASPPSPLGFAHRRAAACNCIGVVLPPKQSVSQKFEAAHQVLLDDMGWFCTMTRVMNLTMHSPFRISCGNAQVLARSLPAFVRLEVLHLGSNAIADAGAAAIVQACASQGTVKQLYLHRNRLTSHSAAAIGSALESSSCRLELLQLGGNMLGDTGVKRIALALRGQTSLITLDVVGAPCSTARAFLTHLLAVKQPLDRYQCRGGICCAAL